MKKQLALLLATVLAAFALDVAASAAEAKPLKGTRPNIILVMTDDQGMGDLSCMGNKVLKTPNIDKFYEMSTRFADFHVSPTCSPSRAAIMSGRHEFCSGVTHTIYERHRMALSTTTLPQVLRTAGYETGIFGKWHLGDEDAHQPYNRGFSEVFIHGAGGIGQNHRKTTCVDFPPNLEGEGKYFDNAILHNDTIVMTKGFCTDVFLQAALGWMKKQYDSKTVMKLALLPILLCVLGSTVFAVERPNIIYLMSDDQSTYTLGCYGNPDVKTPHIDKLAADGMVFDHHYTTTAICMSSRATVMTGMYEYKHGCNFRHGEMMTSTWEKSYPVLLRRAGYLTAFAGKFGFELKGTPRGRGSKLELPVGDFDRWGGGEGQTFYETKRNPSMAAYAEDYPHSTLSYGAFGRDFIREATQTGKPFCLSISFKAPHKPATPDPKFDDVYAGKAFTKPANFGREHGEHFSKQSKQDRQYQRFHSWGYSDNYDEVMAIYHQQIYAIDVAVGMIRQALEEASAADNTVIIYTSDNGYFCGSHGYGSKVLPYEEASRVPMILYDPRHPNSGKGLRSDALTGNIDFAPTLLTLAGLPVPENMDGANLMKLYDDPSALIHESLALINVWGEAPTHALGVVTQDMKYLHWAYAAEGFEATEELYHLENDPLELTNQANNPEYGSVIQQLRKAYDGHLTRWKAEAVPYNNYERFGTLFDRDTPWSGKEGLIRKKGVEKSGGERSNPRKRQRK